MSNPMSPYASLHSDPQGAGDVRPTAMQIIHDNDLVGALPSKVFLVTGTSSGIGVETVRALHATGADVYMQARDIEKAEKVRREIIEISEGQGKLELVYMELGSFRSVREGARELLKKCGNRLNVLVCNAGESFRTTSSLFHHIDITQGFAIRQKGGLKTASRSSSGRIISLTSCSSSSSCLPYWPQAPRSLTRAWSWYRQTRTARAPSSSIT